MQPVLYIFSGLPGTGKTTLAMEIATKLHAIYFRLDTIEQALRDICKINVQGEGYRMTYKIVSDHLKLGYDVIVDCVNPWNLTRREWEQVALQNQAKFINIEIKCSNPEEHRHRVENRQPDIEGFQLPTWNEVMQRDYEEWKEKRIEIETSHRTIQECVQELLGQIFIERD